MILNFIHIINICTILLSSVGIVSYRHYCQDKVKSFSFFANLTTPCSKISACKKKATPKYICCSKKQKSSQIEQNSCEHEFPKNKTTYQKKACCVDKSSYSQSDVLSSETIEDNHTFNSVAILPDIAPVFVFLSITYSPKPVFTPIIYPLLGFCPPPPNTPLYILHESFLC